MTVDFRTRKDSEIQDVAIGAFLSGRFGELVAQAQPYIQPWLCTNTPVDFSINCDGELWQLTATDNSIEVQAGSAASGLLVLLTASEFSGLVNDLYTPMTFFAGGTLRIERGELNDFLDWWMLLRATIDQRPIHNNQALAFDGRDGKPLDLHRAFSLDDDPHDMRHFLETAGFIHIKGVFSETEMGTISSDIDHAVGNYHEGDNKSWWATTKDGTRRLVRLQQFDQVSSATKRLLKDSRFERIGQLTGCGHTHSGLEGNAIEALIKPLNVVQGISDLPWHKDCSLGRHSYDCCSLTVGVSVTGADAGSGQLRVVAGSHRVLMWPSLLSRAESYGLPVIDLPTGTGDITAHLSCTHHMAQAPTTHERRVLYTSFRLPSVGIDSSTESRARINQAREAAYKIVSQ